MEKKNGFRQLAASFTGMFKRLFVHEKLSALEEEAIQTPMKTIVKNFFRNRLGVIGLVCFVCFLLFCFGGSKIFPITSTYTELTNASLRPGTNYLAFPRTLDTTKITKIASGVSFSVALDSDGNITMWGTEPNQKQKNVSDLVFDIPQEVKDANIVDITTGGKHVLALDDMGNFYGWGYYGNKQTMLPKELLGRVEKDVQIIGIYAATNWSAVLTSDKELTIWGSSQAMQNLKVSTDLQGRIVDLASGDNNMILLLDDGTVTVIGDKSSEFYAQVPEALKSGSILVKDIAATNRNALVLTQDGDIFTWGSAQDTLLAVPAYEGDILAIDAGYRHFNMLMEDGSVISWGANQLGQLDAPEGMTGVKTIYSDYFQNYAIDENGTMSAWGNKGYLMGSDEYGRDMFTRLIHGGRISLTVGAIAMFISVLIAIIVGLTAGYFGGWVDQLLMRLTDIFSAIPFYPVAVTLSYVIGNSLSESQKLYLIMVIMGLLSWMSLARLIRAQLLVEREKDFVLAAKALGIKQGKIMWRHILPNVFNLVIVNITLGYASSLLSEAGLSFLGFGVSQPTPSWGNMLTSAQQSTVIQMYWWRWFIPGMFVVLAALSVNLIGDALREAMDPRENER